MSSKQGTGSRKDSIMYDSITKYSGPYLGVIRRWIQRKFRNGEYVTWGSETDILEGCTLTPGILERLAGEIRDAVLREFSVKDKDHVYKYSVICVGSGTFEQKVDTSKEAWTALFNLEGPVYIIPNNENNKLPWEQAVFKGDANEARIWIREHKLEDMYEENTV